MKLDFSKLKNLKPLLIVVKILPWLGWVSLLLIIVFSSNFLHQYFYKTITEAQDIYIIRAKVSLQAVDVNLFDSVLMSMEQKKLFNLNQIGDINDPFYNNIPVPPASARTN